MKARSALRVIAAAIAIGVALTGCSAGGKSSEEAGPQKLSLAISAAPADFTIGKWGGGESWPYTAVYDSVLGVDNDGVITPGIAETWSYSDDNLVLTLNIREGQTFSDGEVVDAEAVAASLNQSISLPNFSGNFASVDTVVATDANTVVITLKQADASLLTRLATPPGAVGAPNALTAEASTLTPIGSGPYVLDTSATTTGSVYSYTKNLDNWNADAYPFDTVEIRVIADPTAGTNALKAGQIDYYAADSSQLAQFPESEFSHGEGRPTAVGILWLADRDGTVVPALKDVRVRQAINLAIDRESIATKLIDKGNATDQVMNPESEAYSAELNEQYAFNVDKAKQLMAEAGYADGFSVTMPSTVVSTAFDSTLQQELGEIGITVTYESVPFQDFFTKVNGQTYGMYFMFTGYTGSDSGDVTSAISGAFNPFNTTDSELTTLIQAANSAPADEQAEKFKAVNEYFVDQAWFAPVIYPTGPHVTTKRVVYTPPAISSTNLLSFGLAASE